jgi:hypothetical protein
MSEVSGLQLPTVLGELLELKSVSGTDSFPGTILAMRTHASFIRMTRRYFEFIDIRIFRQFSMIV